VRERRLAMWIGGGLLALVLAAYVETMAGSTSFWDCGEFIATSYILGIPHPPATPLYVVLGRVFTLLPLPGMSIAEKVNFLSSWCGALGIVVLFLITVELIEERRGMPKDWVDRVVVYGSALVGSLFTAWSNTYWAGSIEAEVYSISAFVMGLTTWLALRWSREPEKPQSTRYIYLIVYLLSLGVGFHLGTVLTYPAIALYVLLFRHKSFKDADVVVFSLGFFLFLLHVNLKFSGVPALLVLLLFVVLFVARTRGGNRFVAVATGLFVLGISIHLFLLLRSAQQPAIDEADPQSWGNLMAVLRREQYPPGNLFVRKASWHFQIVDHFWRYFKEQYELVGDEAHRVTGMRLALVPILVGVAGLVSLFRTARRSFWLLFVTLVVCSLGLIVFLNFSANEVRERDYFYSGCFYFYGIAIGVGLAALLDWFFAAGPGERRALVDRVGYVAGVGIFLALTAMVYQRYHFEHKRTHERVPWGYGYNMLAGLEPNALVFTNGDNDTFPLWYQQEVERFRRDARVLNLSLLNTSWYIRQLRDNEPKVAFNWTNAEIDNLPYAAQRLSVDQQHDYQPRDLAVRQILRDNFGKRPIYFAVTIPMETLAEYKDYLAIEGLVYRLVRDRASDRRDFDKIEHNATQVYRYDGILTKDGKLDTSVYRDANQRSLIQNYAGAFVRIGQHAEEAAVATGDEAGRQAEYAKAVRFYQQALEISPDFEALVLALGSVYGKMEHPEQEIALYENQVRRNPDDPRWRFKLTEAYLGRGGPGDEERAVGELREAARRHPDEEEVRELLVQALYELGRAGEAERAVQDWETRRPGDAKMRKFYDAVRGGQTPRLLETKVGRPGDGPAAGDSARRGAAGR